MGRGNILRRQHDHIAMTTEARTYTEEEWVAAKKRGARMSVPVSMIVDAGQEASGLASQHSQPTSSLQSMYLYNVQEGQWAGPWNLTFPGELQRYLEKRDLQGRVIYALEPPPSSPSHVQTGTEAGVNGSVDYQALQDQITELKTQLAAPQRSGRRRRHRGNRRRSNGG